MAEVVEGKLQTNQILTVRFSEFEATVDGMVAKIQQAINRDESLVLTDSQGNQILDSQGTQGRVSHSALGTVCIVIPLYEMHLFYDTYGYID